MCEFCGNDKDIIFPFQLNKCQRCEGEPSLLVAGLGGLIALRPFPLTWKNWKIPKPRRLARALSKDRREGEGGEEGLELDEDQGFKSGMQEKRGDITGERQGRGETYQAFAPGKLVKAFSRSKGNKDNQEMTGGTESERGQEMKCDEVGEERGKGQHGLEYIKEIAKSKERENVHARREKVNLLKVLHIDRLKKNISKGDRRGSDSETYSSNESLDVGQERKGRWKVSGLASLAKGFSKSEIEVEGKTEVKEEESKEKETGFEEEGKASRQAEEIDDISDKSQTEAAEREKSGAENVEKRTLMNLLKPHQLSAVSSRGKSKAEENRSKESDGKGEMRTEEEGQHEPAFITRTNWRGRKTRKARRENRGRKIREGTEKEGKAEGGQSAEANDVDYCTERGGGQD